MSMMNTRKQLEDLIAEWEALHVVGGFDHDILNRFIAKHEDLLACYGLFLWGVRVKEMARLPQAHETFDGVMGIVSMSIQVIKKKANGIL